MQDEREPSASFETKYDCPTSHLNIQPVIFYLQLSWLSREPHLGVNRSDLIKSYEKTGRVRTRHENASSLSCASATLDTNVTRCEDGPKRSFFSAQLFGSRYYTSLALIPMAVHAMYQPGAGIISRPDPAND